jgi:glutathione peroxidase
MSTSVHQFELPSISGEGEIIKLSDFAGKKILLVNTASECGNTPQYLQLEALHQEFHDKIAIIACPSNDFAQEPESNASILSFCQQNFGVSFPLSARLHVKGERAHPLYQFVAQKALNGQTDSEVKWNFQKYLFDEQGTLIQIFDPQTDPVDDRLLYALGLEF